MFYAVKLTSIYIEHCILYSVYCYTPYSVSRKVYNVQCTMYNTIVQCILYTVQCTLLYQYTMHSGIVNIATVKVDLLYIKYFSVTLQNCFFSCKYINTSFVLACVYNMTNGAIFVYNSCCKMGKSDKVIMKLSANTGSKIGIK